MKGGLLLRNARIYTPYEFVYPGYVLVENGVIKAVGREPYPREPGVEVINLNGEICGPGFVDTHIHGVLGYDTMDGNKRSILEMSRVLVKYGVTAFIPTTVTAPHEKLVEVARALKEAVAEWSPGHGSRILGLHLEGPYISPVKAGAHNTQYIREPSIKEFDEYYEASGGLVREVTMAPELKGALEFTRHAVSKNTVVQIGHTNATYEEALSAVLAGASKATHIYNAMREIHHREPGVVIALLQSPSVFIEVIVDFVHVAPQMVKFTVDYTGTDRVVAITDAISATGLPNGVYELGGLKIRVEKGVSRLVDTGGLAGSTLTMDRAFKNLVQLGYSLNEAFKMASTNPARSVNAHVIERVGLIKPGFKADIVVLDKNLEVSMTMINGCITYQKPESKQY